MKKILFTSFIILGLIFLIISCEEEKGVVISPSPFAIQEVDIPEVLSTLSSKPVLLTAKVTHPDASAGIQRVEMLLPDFTGQGVDTVMLYDDGGAINPASGDVVALDQIYTAEITPDQQWESSLSGTFSATVLAVAKDGSELESSPQSLKIFPNQPPEVLSFVFPDSIPDGMLPTTISVTVNDNDGLADVRWALIEGYEAGTSFLAFRDTLFNPMDNSPVFSKTIDSSYAAGKKGDYSLKFYAQDTFGDTSKALLSNVLITNTPPVLSDDFVPDTLIVPSTGAVSAKITVHVSDAQTLADVKDVYFNAYLPNDSAATNNPFTMYDNGLPYDPNNSAAVGDDVAGDGTYTLTIFLPAGTPGGDYKFHFFAEDLVNQLTTGSVDTIRVF